MEAGRAVFGDVEFMHKVMDELRGATEEGKFFAQGTGHVGKALGVARVPVIKNQTISAYDPRVIEVTGITMMITAQGADHTAGNLPHYETVGKTAADLVPISLDFQEQCAAADAFGLCNFGRTVTNEHQDFILQAMTDAHDVELPEDYFVQVGRETLRLENQFNKDAGFGDTDNALPQFFYDEELPPRNLAARFSLEDINEASRVW